ncbi:MAG: 4-aminobutyrate transaminase [Gammaproteobacteria bacterium RIFCSPLOWO2_02_FULL_61_13]|nr:MAG: 4-aminobutyrate transaminase [Gammaproteobacteria bacterium RIFCSPLOWO2_02_FULL_61_13]
MSTNAGLHDRRNAAVVRGVSNILSIYADRALNAEIWDVEGKRYIDFASGIAVVNTGHNHPRVMAAVEAQLKKFSHTCFQVTPYENYVALAEKLNAIVPGSGPKKTLLLTTGAEAVENAVKIARFATGRPGVIAFSGAFHGRTLMGMALTGKVAPYKLGFGPFPGDIYHAPFPIAYHGVTVADALKALDNLFKSEIDPARVAAMIIEPVLGEGGFYIAPSEYLQALRRLCDEHGILFIADEIQTGFARTGRMFAIEHAGVEPDMVTLAKSLAGGFPLSAVTGKAKFMDAPNPGGLGGTYAGSPVACAAALAAIEVIEKEKLADRANQIGELIRRRLGEMAGKMKCIGDIRALGAMVSMELVKNGNAAEPEADLTKALVQEAAKRGLVILPCGVRGNVIRFLVPLTAPDALINEGMDILEAALGHLIG